MAHLKILFFSEFFFHVQEEGERVLCHQAESEEAVDGHA